MSSIDRSGSVARRIEWRQHTGADVAAAAAARLPGAPVHVRILGGPDAGAVYPVVYIAEEADRLVLVVAASG